jgi:hypothetical protein
LTTLLAIDLIPKPVPPTISKEVLQLCLAGLREERDLTTLIGLRSMGVSKILKAELVGLQTQLTKSQIVPVALTARNIAHGILVDLPVADIRPICTFLADFEYEGQWKTLATISGSLEKSTQGRVMTGLKDQDVQVFNPILKQGISEFESDRISSPTFDDKTDGDSCFTKGDVESSSGVYQPYQLERGNLRCLKFRYLTCNNPHKYHNSGSKTFYRR